jgi:TatD DNase family protein
MAGPAPSGHRPRLLQVVDTHCHLGLCEEGDAELVEGAEAVGVARMLTVGIDAEASREAIAAAEAHPEVLACVGRHPNGATGFDDAAAAEIERLASHPRVAAVGETGLDYYRDRASRTEQRRAFEAQIEIARRVGKPLVIHVRDGERATEGEALGEVLETLRARAQGLAVILHCFSAPPERVEEVAEHGWLCSFAGNLTYPRAKRLREAARLVPDELLLVETDAPFLAPQPLRGKPNRPANVVATARELAELRGVSYAELEALVDANAARVFGW